MTKQAFVTVIRCPTPVHLWEVAEPRINPQEWTGVLAQAEYIRDNLCGMTQHQADVVTERLYLNIAKTMGAEIARQAGHATHSWRGQAPELKHIAPIDLLKVTGENSMGITS